MGIKGDKIIRNLVSEREEYSKVESRVEAAKQRHAGGYHCSQAVYCAFCDLVGVTEEQAMKEAAPYAGGAKGTCGAVMAAELVLSAKAKEQGLDEKNLIEALKNRFREKITTVVCRELSGGKGQPRLRTCRGCVEDASEILEEMLGEL